MVFCFMDAEIQLHLIKARKKLDAASSLYENGFYDDAASRAYYAMYHAAKAALLLKEIDTKSHKGLIAKFGEEFIQLGEMGKDKIEELSHGFRVRMKSDYEPGFEIDKEGINSLLNEANDFVDSVEDYIKKKRGSERPRFV